MKKKLIVKLLLLLLVSAVFVSCGDNSKTGHQHAASSQEYTCPMHPQIVQEGPGTCPICKMDLVPKNASHGSDSLDSDLDYLLQPVNEQVVSELPSIKPVRKSVQDTLKAAGKIVYDTRNRRSISSRVSGRIEKLYIKYNYQLVRKGQLIMEIYSPELVSAQQELLYISRSGNSENLLERAKQRLSLLGMSAGQISQILKSGKASYRVPVYSSVSGYILEQENTAAEMPENNQPVMLREGRYVDVGEPLFTVYQSDGLAAEFFLNPDEAAKIHKNSRILVQRNADKSQTVSASIGLVQPVIREGENFTQARVYLKNSSFRPGELVSGLLPFSAEEGWWVPKEAVLFLGSRAVVFKKENKVYVPKEITAGISAGGLVQVKESIGDWNVASNASYLIDNESFVKVQQGEEK